jgi:hypothetical protein
VTNQELPLDVLFIDDNTESMDVNQNNLGTQFPSLFSMISGFDFRVAITTTDLSGSDQNPNDGLSYNGRNGALISFSDGSTYLTPQSSSPEAMFLSEIKRPETITCNTYVQGHNYCVGSGACPDYDTMCPNPDSRGIYVANLAVQQNEGSWMRSSAPLHIVILSNSDERANGQNLVALDQPGSIAATVQAAFPGKQVFVHSLIVQPNDQTCLNAQHVNNEVYGFYGTNYAAASSATGGVNGTICLTGTTTYDSQLQAIGQSASSQLMQNIPLKCSTSDSQLTYSFTPTPAAAITGTVTNGTTLALSAPLPTGTTLNLQYTCTQSD